VRLVQTNERGMTPARGHRELMKAIRRVKGARGHQQDKIEQENTTRPQVVFFYIL